MRFRVLSIAAIFLTASMTLAQTTRPAGGRAEKFGQRIHEAMAKLNLTDDQKQKIDDILEQARQQFQKELPTLRDATPEQRRDKVKQIMEGVRQEIGDLLTPEQKHKLQEILQKQRAAKPGAENESEERHNRAEKFKRRNAETPTTAPVDAAIKEIKASSADIGRVAPDVSLHWINGEPLHLSMFKGHPVVLIFGSYSSPVFRDKAAELPHLAEMYNGRAKIVVVYTKEAHPSDGWDVRRNKEDDVEIPQPTDMAGRRAVARQAISALNLTNIPVAMDSMDDAASKAFDAFPDGAVIIGKDGHIVARQHWLEPTSLPAMINQALKH